MEQKRCHICTGSGKVLGGGMMQWDCDNCNGTGKILDIKSSSHYNDAIDKIQATDPAMGRDTAEKIFDEELKRQEAPNSKRRKRNVG